MDWNKDISVLLVDDQLDFAEMAADLLERESDRLTVTTAPSAQVGLDVIESEEVDCVVSDYDMPGRNGIEFLESVRGEYADMPFILFTGKGSEAIASEAISAGVTDYMQKESGTDIYPVLANRITNEVERDRAHRQRVRQLRAIETAQEGISILGEDGRFMYVNRTWAELYGYEPEELIGEHWEIVYSEEEAARIRNEILPSVEHRGHWHGRTVGLRSDNSTFVEEHVVATTERDELICTVRDAGSHTSLQRKFELVARASTDAFWEWDINTDEVLRNSDYLPQFGYATTSEERVDASWWRERIHPDDRERVLSAVQQAVDTPDDIYDETYRFRKQNGAYGYLRSRGYVVYDDTGEPERMVGAHIDVTDQKRREEKLEQTAAQFRRIFEESRDGIVILDAQSGEIRDANRKACEMLGQDRDEIVANSPEEFSAEDPHRFGEFVEAIENPGAAEAEGHPGSAGTTDEYPAKVSASLVEIDDQQNVLTVVRNRSTGEDQEQLQQENERLEQFAGNVSHDLQTPLNVVEGRLALAREECDSEHIAPAIRSVDRSLDLIEELVSLAQNGKKVSEIQTVDFVETAKEAWQNVKTADATLSTQVNHTLRADPGRLQQLLENLFQNAIDHAGTRISVTVGTTEQGFYVADDGPGIGDDDREKVFERGYSTSDGGTGYGLNIVKEICDGHGWEIDIVDTAAEGARFEFTGVNTISVNA